LLLLTVVLCRSAIGCELVHHGLPGARLIDLGARNGLLKKVLALLRWGRMRVKMLLTFIASVGFLKVGHDERRGKGVGMMSDQEVVMLGATA
jgi:hypothetical protein